MEFPDVPGRAFLDTSVVNFTLDHGEQIYDGAPLPENLSNHATRDINAIHNISVTGQPAMWQFAISPLTYKEVMSTSRLPIKLVTVTAVCRRSLFWRDKPLAMLTQKAQSPVADIFIVSASILDTRVARDYALEWHIPQIALSHSTALFSRLSRLHRDRVKPLGTFDTSAKLF